MGVTGTSVLVMSLNNLRRTILSAFRKAFEAFKMKASTLSTVARPLLPPVWRKISTELKADAHQMN